MSLVLSINCIETLCENNVKISSENVDLKHIDDINDNLNSKLLSFKIYN